MELVKSKGLVVFLERNKDIETSYISMNIK